MQNNSTKPLSESELAKQKVIAIHPLWIAGESGQIYEPLFSEDGIRTKWEKVAESWINAASELPQPLSEDGPAEGIATCRCSTVCGMTTYCENCIRKMEAAESASPVVASDDPCKMDDAQYEEYIYGPNRAKWPTSEPTADEMAQAIENHLSVFGTRKDCDCRFHKAIMAPVVVSAEETRTVDEEMRIARSKWWDYALDKPMNVFGAFEAGFKAAHPSPFPAANPVSSGFICAEWRVRYEGPMLNLETMERKQYVNRCDLPEGHEGDHVDQVLLVNWPKESTK